MKLVFKIYYLDHQETNSGEVRLKVKTTITTEEPHSNTAVTFQSFLSMQAIDIILQIADAVCTTHPLLSVRIVDNNNNLNIIIEQRSIH